MDLDLNFDKLVIDKKKHEKFKKRNQTIFDNQLETLPKKFNFVANVSRQIKDQEPNLIKMEFVMLAYIQSKNLIEIKVLIGKAKREKN